MMKALLGNYVVIKKSTLAMIAALGALGALACYYYKKSGGHPVEDIQDAAQDVAQKGKRKAKEVAKDISDS